MVSFLTLGGFQLPAGCGHYRGLNLFISSVVTTASLLTQLFSVTMKILVLY